MKIITTPLWMQTTKPPSHPHFTGSSSCEVAVVGGGITGVTTAFLLAQHGINVTLLEAATVGSGTTGRTTAKITLQHGLKYSELIKKFGAENAKKYADANQMGLDKIVELIRSENIDCDFERSHSFVYTTDEKHIDKFEDEKKAMDSIGISSLLSDKSELPFNINASIGIANQAKFHPLKYLYGLVRSLGSNKNVHIYEHSKVISIERGSRCIVKTDSGELTADFVVVATNYPVKDMPGFYFTRLHQQRSYIISIQIGVCKIDGMYINLGEPVNSIRTYSCNSNNYLLLGGYGHKTGKQKEYLGSYSLLQDFMKNSFNVFPDEISQWSSQDCLTLDGLPYAGNLTKKTTNIFIATGYGKWGMTNSTASAIMVTNLIVDSKDTLDLQKLFSPQRVTPKESAKVFALQSADTIKNFTLGNLKMNRINLNEIPKGRGKIVNRFGSSYAVYKDETGNIFELTAYCTHMKCPLVYNELENSFDCPCHGSRFSITGEVLEGPAKKDLQLIRFYSSKNL